MGNFDGLRFLASALAGPVVAVAVWMGVINYGSPFYGMTLLGLTPVIAAGITGGLTSALLAPRHKLQCAASIGLVLGGGLLILMFSGDRFPLEGRNPFYWYWPAWLIPGFALGGYLGYLVHRPQAGKASEDAQGKQT